MNSVHLQKALVQELQAVGVRLSHPQVVNLALWSQGLATSHDCHLTNLALHLPLTGKRQSVVQRLRRCAAAPVKLGTRLWASGAPFVRPLARA